MGLGALAGSQVRTVEQAVVALAVTRTANALCTAVLLPLLADLIPRQRAGEFTGLGSAVGFVQPLGAALAGLAADATGTLRSAMLAAGLFLLLRALLLTPVRIPAAALTPPDRSAQTPAGCDVLPGRYDGPSAWPSRRAVSSISLSKSCRVTIPTGTPSRTTGRRCRP
jgi:MFS family permease